MEYKLVMINGEMCSANVNIYIFDLSGKFKRTVSSQCLVSIDISTKTYKVLVHVSVIGTKQLWPDIKFN